MPKTNFPNPSVKTDLKKKNAKIQTRVIEFQGPEEISIGQNSFPTAKKKKNFTPSKFEGEIWRKKPSRYRGEGWDGKGGGEVEIFRNSFNFFFLIFLSLYFFATSVFNEFR